VTGEEDDMKYQDIVELKKRMDFNRTESEVLVKLVEGALYYIGCSKNC
jgi:hypothetical protein